MMLPALFVGGMSAAQELADIETSLARVRTAIAEREAAGGLNAFGRGGRSASMESLATLYKRETDLLDRKRDLESDQAGTTLSIGVPL